MVPVKIKNKIFYFYISSKKKILRPMKKRYFKLLKEKELLKYDIRILDYFKWKKKDYFIEAMIH